MFPGAFVALLTLTPYFQHGDCKQALTLFAHQDYVQAAQRFLRYAEHHPRATDRLPAEFLGAEAALRAGDFAAAVEHFSRLQKSYPLLADEARVRTARAELARKQPNAALQALTHVLATSAVDGEAKLLRAEAAHALGHDDEALTHYRAYVEQYPKSYRVWEIQARIALLLDSLGQKSAAMALAQNLAVHAPTEWASEQVVTLLPNNWSSTLSVGDRLLRAHALFDAMRNQESERAFLQVASEGAATPAQTCEALYHAGQSVFKQRNRPRAAPIFEQAISACASARDEDLWVKSIYQDARCLGTRGDKDIPSTQRGIAQFEKIWREHPAHSYADDAELRQAELEDELHDEAAATLHLDDLPARFPAGDQAKEALWRRGFRGFEKGDFATAETALTRELQMFPREEGWWEAGRTLYFLARTLEKNGRLPAAIQRYEQAVRDYPLSYYALCALTRLRTTASAQQRKLVAELRRLHSQKSEWSLSSNALTDTPGFARGLELLRLGLGSDAAREFGNAGLTLPHGNKPMPHGDDDAARWELGAVLYDRAGDVMRAHTVFRYQLLDYARSYPDRESHKRWQIAYPRAYGDLVAAAVKSTGQPEALEFAIMREESAFDPNLESFANAIGLTQLTAAPATQFAEGLPHDAKALRDPKINLTIGARELGHCYRTFNQNPALAIAAYNAGEAAVKRWLADPDRRGRDLDEFVEAIPYDETRGYTKRVLSSYFAYAWLYDKNPLPQLPMTLPR